MDLGVTPYSNHHSGNNTEQPVAVLCTEKVLQSIMETPEGPKAFLEETHFLLNCKIPVCNAVQGSSLP